ERHLETGRRLDSSLFFIEHRRELRKQVARALGRLPARPVFLAQVAPELRLASLLPLLQRVDPGKLYRQLAACEEQDIIRFLELNGIPQAPSFTAWYRAFIRDAYLYSYSSSSSLSHALEGIGQRVWQARFPPGDTQRIAE